MTDVLFVYRGLVPIVESAVRILPVAILPDTLNLVTDFGSDLNLWNDYLETASGDVTLIVPPGTYDCTGARLANVATGGTILIQGEDPDTCIFTDPFAFSTSQQFGSGGGAGNEPWPRFATATAGATSITLLDLARVSLFDVGDWVVVMCYDLQGAGSFPQNNHFFQFLQLTGVDDGTGVLSFATPLLDDYLSTYPLREDGDGAPRDQGGSATVIKMNPVVWNSRVIVRNLTINSSINMFGSMRDVLYDNCIFNTDPVTPLPSQSVSHAYTNCSFIGDELEMDKLVETVTFAGCDLQMDQSCLLTQSSSITDLVMDNCTALHVTGTPRNARFTNCNITGNIRIRPQGYGITESVYMENTHVETWGDSSFGQQGGAFTDWTHAGSGVFTLTEPNFFHNIFVPGGWYVLCETAGGSPLGPAFQVLDVSEVDVVGPDDIMTVTTSLTGSEPAIAVATAIRQMLCPSLTVINCPTGYFRPLSFPAAEGRPYGEYYRTTVDDFSLGISPSAVVPRLRGMQGELVSIVVNVTRAYTGALGTLRAELNPGSLSIALDDATGSSWNPRFDLKTVGTRTITPSGVTGTAGADLTLTYPAGAFWFRTDINPGPTANISAEDPSVWPVFTVEIILDQGIT